MPAPRINFMGVCYKQSKTYRNYPRPITTAHLGNLKTVKLQYENKLFWSFEL